MKNTFSTSDIHNQYVNAFQVFVSPSESFWQTRKEQEAAKRGRFSARSLQFGARGGPQLAVRVSPAEESERQQSALRQEGRQEDDQQESARGCLVL